MLKYADVLKYAQDKLNPIDESVRALAELLAARKHPRGWTSLNIVHKPYKDGSEDIDGWYDTPNGKYPLDLSEEDLERFDPIAAKLNNVTGYNRLTGTLDNKWHFRTAFSWPDKKRDK